MTVSHPRVILKPGVASTPGGTIFWQKFREAAKKKQKRIIFPEGNDPRVLSAASYLVREGICVPLLVGKPDTVVSALKNAGFSDKGIEILDPSDLANRETFAEDLFERRKAKGMTLEQSLVLMEDPLYFSAIALKRGVADGFVGGAVRSTADTVRAAFAALSLAPEADMAFGAFLMECPSVVGPPRCFVSSKFFSQNLAAPMATAANARGEG